MQSFVNGCNHFGLSNIYGNGTAFTYTYDSANRVTQVKCDGAVLYKYTYSSCGELGAFVHDGMQTTYLYDLSGRLVSETSTTTGGAFISRISYTFVEYAFVKKRSVKESTVAVVSATVDEIMGLSVKSIAGNIIQRIKQGRF